MKSFFVPTMHCKKCQATIESVLKPIEGTRYVRVDLDARRVDVGGTADPEVLAEALRKVGFAPH